MSDLKGQEPDFTVNLTTGIPDIALLPGTFAACQLPSLEELTWGIEQFVSTRPADNKTNAVHKELRQPGRTRKASVKHRQDLLTKALRQANE